MNVLIVTKCFGLKNHLIHLICAMGVRKKGGRELMTAYQNNFLIEVEEYFGALLTDNGLTNDQALVLVKKQYGEHGHEYVCDLIKKEEEYEH